jgi:hypothetical protein
MFEVWLVQLAFPFWATFYGCDMLSRARKKWKKLFGATIGALGLYGFTIYFLALFSGAPGIPIIEDVAREFVLKYGTLPAIILIGILIADFMAWVGFRLSKLRRVSCTSRWLP